MKRTVGKWPQYQFHLECSSVVCNGLTLSMKYTGKHFRGMYARASRLHDQLALTRNSSSKTQLDQKQSMLANTTAFGEADVIAVMHHYFSKTSLKPALTPVFSGHTSSLASDLPKGLTTFSVSDTFSTKQIIFANHAKTLLQASNSKP